MRRTQISMTDEQAEALRRLSNVRARSQSALLRDALDGLLEGDLRATRAERARKVLGAFSSGIATTSEHHDDAFEDALSS